jgi:hypothetical protein
MHEIKHFLKKKLDEIPTLEVDPFSFWVPEELMGSDLTPEEKVLYTVFCMFKSDRLSKLPDIKRIANHCNMKPRDVEKAMAALSEKGITYD